MHLRRESPAHAPALRPNALQRARIRLVDHAVRLPAALARNQHAIWLIPAGVVGLVLAADLLTAANFRTNSWLVLVPIVAGGVCTPVVTAAFGVLALVLYPTLNQLWQNSALGLEDFVLVALGAVLAVPVSWVNTRSREFLRHVQSAADATREVVLRPIPYGWGGVHSAQRYLAADVEARVGGDFYEVVASPYGARVVLGDVQGKGLSAVSTAAALVGTFREVAYNEPDLGLVALRMEARLRRHNWLRSELGEPDERFATAVILSFPKDRPDEVEVVDFGHACPLVIGPGGVRPLIDAERADGGHGLPLGMAILVKADTGAEETPAGVFGDDAPGNDAPGADGHGADADGGAVDGGAVDGGAATDAAATAARIAARTGPAPDGFGEPTGEGMPPVVRCRFGPEDTVLLVSDGVTEARDRQDVFFPLRERLEEIHAERVRAGGERGIPPDELVGLVVDAVLAHTGGRLADDTALLAVRRLPIRSGETVETSSEIGVESPGRNEGMN